MIKSKTTIRDIAKKLDLHHSTVSRALRNHPDVNPETRNKILTLVKELDYHPNSIAQALTKKRSKTIGIIVPTITNNFFAHAISGIESVAYNAGYYIMLCQSNESYEQELLTVSALISNRVCGAMICPSQTTKDHKHFKKFQRHEIPFVFYDRECNNIKASKVVVDDFEGAYNAVEHLINSGYRRIAHFAGPQYLSNSLNRCKGYKSALKKNGIPVDENLIIKGGFTEEYGSEGFKKLQDLEKLPDAIFTVNDTVAIGAFRQIKKSGLRIPNDIALAGFSNNPITTLVDPPLTSVFQPAHELGQVAARLLIAQIESKEEPFEPERIVLKTKLIVRESTVGIREVVGEH